MDLVRQILLEIEEVDDGSGFPRKIDIPDFDNVTVVGHLMLLDEAGYIEGVSLRASNVTDYRPNRITWDGHEFLDAVRDPKIWTETKSELSKISGATTIEVIKQLAVSLTKTAIGLPA